MFPRAEAAWRLAFLHDAVIPVTAAAPPANWQSNDATGVAVRSPEESEMDHRKVISGVAAAPLFAVAVMAAPSMESAQAASFQPTVVELFTSQGCSSCPPANANLAALSDRPGVLALSFSVTYWDQLGWKDTFAKPEFTERQVNYEPRLDHDGPFTPQIVVDGRADTIGNRLTALDRRSRSATTAFP
jgi:hypothetical protein